VIAAVVAIFVSKSGNGLNNQYSSNGSKVSAGDHSGTYVGEEGDDVLSSNSEDASTGDSDVTGGDNSSASGDGSNNNSSSSSNDSSNSTGSSSDKSAINESDSNDNGSASNSSNSGASGSNSSSKSSTNKSGSSNSNSSSNSGSSTGKSNSNSSGASSNNSGSSSNSKTVASGTPLATHGKLSVSGTKLVDKNGNSFQLKGVSTHGLQWFPDYVNYDGFKSLRDDWNVNVVRLAMYVGEGGYSDGANKTTLKNLISNGVDYATDLGMYVIIDWHILNPGNPNNYVSDAKTFWEEMSKKYASYDNVIYEICNEPNGCSWSDVKTVMQLFLWELLPGLRMSIKQQLILLRVTPTSCIHFIFMLPLIQTGLEKEW
jgi:hypothetical protein